MRMAWCWHLPVSRLQLYTARYLQRPFGLPPLLFSATAFSSHPGALVTWSVLLLADRLTQALTRLVCAHLHIPVTLACAGLAASYFHFGNNQSAGIDLLTSCRAALDGLAPPLQLAAPWWAGFVVAMG